MSLILELSSQEETEVIGSAAREGVTPTEYVRRRLLPSSVPAITDRQVVGKPFSIMQFAAARRPVEEIDAHVAEIRKSRDEWDQRDRREVGSEPVVTPRPTGPGSRRLR